MAIISDADDGLAKLVGVHGGAGVMGWKRLGTGNMMSSAVDSYEIAELPPGSRAGRQVHSRTEELFYVLSGRALIGLGDEQRRGALPDAGDRGAAAGDRRRPARAPSQRGGRRMSEPQYHVAHLAEPLREGISLTLFQGEPLDLEAAPDQGLDLFLAEMNVDPQPQGGEEP